MVDYHYDDNVSKKLARKNIYRIGIYTIAVFVFVAAGLLIYDILRSKTKQTVVESNTTSILGQTEKKIIFDEPYFRFEADQSWQKIDPSPDYNSYKTLRYRSIKSDLVKQELMVFVDDIPEEFRLTYVLPIEVNGNTIQPFEISPHCGQIVKKNDQTIQTISWAGVNFVCFPKLSSYIIGTSHNEYGYGVKVPGTNSVHRYFFVFIDSQSTPVFSVFPNILRTFEAK